MELEKNTGNHTEKWIIYHQGYCHYSTHGPSMTDWASFYSVDQLLAINEKESVRRFENDLPIEFGGMIGLLRILIKEIESVKVRNIDEAKAVADKIPMIKKFIMDLENEEA